MAGGAPSSADEDAGASISEINVTPLVDIVLVLLIVFMITMPAILAVDAMHEREVGLKLPEASAAGPLTLQPHAIVVNVDESGRYVVDGRTLSSADIEQRLRQAAVNNPVSQGVIVRADRRTQVEFVVFLMDLCNRVGIADCQLATEG